MASFPTGRVISVLPVEQQDPTLPR